jgi:exodeoxyribonuclease V alpha subunit
LRRFRLIDRKRIPSAIAFCATAPRVRRSFFAAWVPESRAFAKPRRFLISSLDQARDSRRFRFAVPIVTLTQKNADYTEFDHLGAVHAFRINIPHRVSARPPSQSPKRTTITRKPQQPPSQEFERLDGLVERVTFHNADSGFCVLRLQVRGERELVTLVGFVPSVAPGEYASASGNWITDREHGRQFKAVFVKISPPTTLTGIERYLGSGMVKGIGPIYAARLVTAFGAAVFDTIERTPERLREVAGIGAVRARKITAGWADQKVIREIMVFLHGHGVSTSRAVRIFKTYGTDAIAVVAKNPYQLARDIRGIGFLSADTIAQKVGIARDSPLRARAGISYALAEASGEGHCGLPREQLIELATKLLEIPTAVIEAAIDAELTDEVLIADTVDGKPSVFLASLYNAEQSIAAHIGRLQGGPPPWSAFDADKAIPWVEQKLSIHLAGSQQRAIRLALGTKLSSSPAARE